MNAPLAVRVFSLVLGVLVALGAGGFGWWMHQETRAAELEGTRLRDEIEGLQAQADAVNVPSAEALDQLRADVTRRREWLGVENRPASSLRAFYFETTAHAEGWQENARAAGIALGPGAEGAGWADVLAAGGRPVEEPLADLTLAAPLLRGWSEALLAARPEAVETIAREGPAGQSDGYAACAATFTFTGHTRALRAFLRRAEAVHPGAVVAAIEAAPLDGERLPTAGPARVVVGENRSRFTVRLSATVVPEAPPAEALRGERLWTEPTAQPAGADWVFDLFSPPRIWFDPARAAFVLEPPLGAPAALDPGLRLHAVRAVPYRWQLAGFAGEGAEARVLLRDGGSGGRVVAATIGEALPGGAKLEALRLERSGEATLDPREEAVAVVWCPHEERFHRLRAGETTLTGRREALFSTGTGEVVLAPGETVETGGFACTLVEVTEEPPGALLRVQAASGPSGRLRYRPYRAPVEEPAAALAAEPPSQPWPPQSTP